MYEGHHPGLVSPERFERVQRLLQKATAEHHKPPREWPFGGSGADYLVLAGEPATDWQMPGPIGDIRDDHRPSLVFRPPDLPGVTHLAVAVRYELIGATYGADTLALDLDGLKVSRTSLSRDEMSGSWSYTGCVAYDPGGREAIDIAFRSHGRMIVKLLGFAATPASGCGFLPP